MVGRDHHEGLVRDDPVEHVPVHRGPAAEDRVVRPLRDQQRLAFVGARVGANGLGEGREPADAGQMQVLQLGRAEEDMDVGLDEPWQHAAALGVDDPGRGAAMGRDLGPVAHGQDAVPGHRHSPQDARPGARPAGVKGEDTAVRDDEIRYRHGLVSS